MDTLQYKQHATKYSILAPRCLNGLGLNEVRDIYAYNTKKSFTQFYVIDKSKGVYTLNHFVFSTGIAGWIQKAMKKRGEKIPERKYSQNVAIDYNTRKEANEEVFKSMKLNKINHD